jgi:hypothetical protein
MPSLAAVLDGCTDDTLLTIATALPTLADLLRFVLTSRATAQRLYFTTTSCGSRTLAAVDLKWPTAAADAGGVTGGTWSVGEDGCRRFSVTPTVAVEQQLPDTWSIVQEVARRWLLACSQHERSWVPRHDQESWLTLWREMELQRPILRRAAVFGRADPDITLSEGGSRATRGGDGVVYRFAVSNAVMRAGLHYAQFTTTVGDSAHFGVAHWLRGPGYMRTLQLSQCDCFYATSSGQRVVAAFSADRALRSNGERHEWEGMQSAQPGDRIGLLLDLDQRTMTVYKNDERLGVMMGPSGLSGAYCWAARLIRRDSSVRIEPAPLPAGAQQ